MSFWRLIATVVVCVAFLTACQNETETKLRETRDTVLTDSKSQAEKIANEMQRVEEESKQLSMQVQSLRNASERQQEAIANLSFAVRTLNENLGNMQSKIKAEDDAAAKAGLGAIWKWIIGIVLVAVVIYLLFILLRPKPLDEEDEDFGAFEEDDLELEEDASLATKDDKGATGSAESIDSKKTT